MGMSACRNFPVAVSRHGEKARKSSIARDLLSRSLFGHLIVIHSFDPVQSLDRRRSLSPSLISRLIAPYKSAMCFEEEKA